MEQLKVRSTHYSNTIGPVKIPATNIGVLAQNWLSVIQEQISLQICNPILKTVNLGTIFKICFIGFLLSTRTDEWNYEVLAL